MSISHCVLAKAWEESRGKSHACRRAGPSGRACEHLARQRCDPNALTRLRFSRAGPRCRSTRSPRRFVAPSSLRLTALGAARPCAEKKRAQGLHSQTDCDVPRRAMGQSIRSLLHLCRRHSHPLVAHAGVGLQVRAVRGRACSLRAHSQQSWRNHATRRGNFLPSLNTHTANRSAAELLSLSETVCLRSC